MGSTNNVSWSKPFGDSSLAQAGQELKNNSNKAIGTNQGIGAGGILGGLGGGLVGLDPITGSLAGAAAGGYLGNKTGQEMDQRTQTPSTSQDYSVPAATNVFNPGSGPRFQDNSAEQAFRNAYLKSLTPNTNFNINAETAPYKATSVGATNNVSKGA